jgi:hypothetical protein
MTNEIANKIEVLQTQWIESAMALDAALQTRNPATIEQASLASESAHDAFFAALPVEGGDEEGWRDNGFPSEWDAVQNPVIIDPVVALQRFYAAQTA